MVLEDYQTLEELLDEFRQEEAEIDIQLAYNIRCIKKADVILKEFKDSEPEDYKVFSPRKVEVVHKLEIEQAYKEKSVYEEKNRELYRKKDLLGKRIFKLDEILNRQDYNLLTSSESEEEKKSKEELQRDSMQKLQKILIKIDNGSNYLEQNQTIQAKQELLIAKKCLSELIDNMLGTVTK